jgi:hypothetical protein
VYDADAVAYPFVCRLRLASGQDGIMRMGTRERHSGIVFALSMVWAGAAGSGSMASADLIGVSWDTIDSKVYRINSTTRAGTLVGLRRRRRVSPPVGGI